MKGKVFVIGLTVGLVLGTITVAGATALLTAPTYKACATRLD
jgi:hypothetical protein